MNEQQKKERDEKDHRDMRFLAQLNLFLLTTIVATFVIYYQIMSMFDIEQNLATHISIASAMIFSGLLLLSIRTHKKKGEKNEPNR